MFDSFGRRDAVVSLCELTWSNGRVLAPPMNMEIGATSRQFKPIGSVPRSSRLQSAVEAAGCATTPPAEALRSRRARATFGEAMSQENVEARSLALSHHRI